MDREQRRLKQRMAATPKDANGHRRFDEELREELVRYARSRITKGATQHAVAIELGIGSRLLWRWLQRDRSPVREVVVEEVAQRRAQGDRRLVLRGGVEIVGLDLDELIAIARALA